jgi:hypothetical protein
LRLTAPETNHARMMTRLPHGDKAILDIRKFRTIA